MSRTHKEALYQTSCVAGLPVQTVPSVLWRRMSSIKYVVLVKIGHGHNSMSKTASRSCGDGAGRAYTFTKGGVSRFSENKSIR